jgi:hypothetical protein
MSHLNETNFAKLVNHLCCITTHTFSDYVGVCFSPGTTVFSRREC